MLAYGLEPFVDSHLKRVAPGAMDWPDWLHQKWSGRDPRKPVRRTDPATLLRAISEDKTWKYFKDTFPGTAQSDAQELRDCRNDWAHNNSMFTEASTFRLLEVAERLLRLTGANAEADQVRMMRREHQQAAIGIPKQYAAQQSYGHPGSGPTTAASPPTSPSTGKPEARRRGFGNFESATATAGLLVSLFIVMSTVGLIVLSSAGTREMVLVAGAGSALTAATLTVSGVWPSPRRFTVTAVAAGLAAACGGVMLIGTHAGRQIPAAGRSGAGPSAIPSRSSPAPARAYKTQMLVDLPGDPGGAVPPQKKAQEFSKQSFRYSLTYPNLTHDETITYHLPPSYRFFTAMVAIGGQPSQAGSIEHVMFTVIGIRANGSRVQLKVKAVQRPGDPLPIMERISGYTELILETRPSGTDSIQRSAATAVWGNPMLTSPALHGRIFPNRH
ncbi:MAG TPA: Swt1 family HEPN domain-containing protein [Streptosporangiaceae bacterium]